MEDAGLMKDVIQKVIGKFNAHTVLHFFWIVELYYLGINILLQLFQSSMLKSVIPKAVDEINIYILNFFSEYSEFVFSLGVIMFLCGLAFEFIRHIPVFRKYKLILHYMDYGLHGGLWLMLIGFTYFISAKFAYLYFLWPMAAWLLSQTWEKISSFINKV